MIWIHEGRIGGGKTYNAVRKGMEYAANGGTVCGNVFWKVDKCIEFCKVEHGMDVEAHQFIELTFDQLPMFHRHCPPGTKEMPTLVFIDEAHIPFNANNWRKTDDEVLEFLTQSRRAFMDVIFVTQHADNLNKQFRRLVEGYVFHRDLQAKHVKGLPFKYPLPQFITTLYDIDRRTRVTPPDFIYKDKRIYQCYESYMWQRELPLLAVKGRTAVRSARGARRALFMKAALVPLLIGLTVAGCTAKKLQEEEAFKSIKEMANAVKVAQLASVSNIQKAAAAAGSLSLPGREFDYAVVSYTEQGGGWVHIREGGQRIAEGEEIPDEGKVLACGRKGYMIDLGHGLLRQVKILERPYRPARLLSPGGVSNRVSGIAHTLAVAE